jgi:hypothetical protein
MTTFDALAYRDNDDDPTEVIQVFSSAKIRDQLRAKHADLTEIRALDIDFTRLSETAFRDIQILAWPAEPEFDAIFRAYLTEKVARLRSNVEADVAEAIADGMPGRVDGLRWFTQLRVAGAWFMVNIDGMGELNPIVVAQGPLPPSALKELLQDAVVSTRRAVLPVILRAIPRPVFLKG